MTDRLDKQEEIPISTGEEDMRQFLRDMQEYPRLSPEEERELARRCAEGDEEAVRKMVGSNLRLVVSIAREYTGRGVPLLDLIQEGSIGLIAAARKFDHTRDLKFSTYATKWIRKCVSQCVLEHSSAIRVPTHTAERMRKIAAVRSVLLQQTGEEPSPADISERSGLPENKVRELIQLTPEVSSLDMPAGEQEDGSLYTLLEDRQVLQPYGVLVRQELEDTIEQMMKTLTDRQRQILRLHFGMADGKVHSLDEIGRKLGISKERVRQIERQAMDKLQKIGQSLGLEDFLNE